MTQYGDHVADQDADDNEDQGQIIGDVQESIAVGRTWRNLRKPSWLTTNMIMVYTLSAVEEAIMSTYRKAEISSESKIWKDTMMKEMNSLHKNNTWELSELPKEKKVIRYKGVFAKK